MLSTTLSILLIAYIPGALLFRLPIARPELRGGLSAEERVFWSVALSLATASVVGMGLAAAGWYQFDRLLWVNGGLSVLLVAVSRGRLRLPPGAPRAGRTALVPVGLVVAGLAVFSHVPPSEYVIGGRDPGAYLIEGIQIAQRGSLTIDDGLVSSLPAEFRDLFLQRRSSLSYYGLRFMAFFVVDPDQGRVVGQFPHLYPVWVAIGYGVNGLSGARQVIVVLAVLGVLAVYFCGTWLFGRPAAVAGALLLTFNVAQVWFSRYPNAEILLQFLAFASILAYSRSSVDVDRFFAPVAATLLALSVLTHFSAVLLVGGIGLAMLLSLVDKRRLSWGFLVTLAVGGVLVAWYYGATLAEYLERPRGILLRAGPVHIGATVAGSVTLLGILWAVRHDRLRLAVRTWFPPCLLGGVTVFATYAYFFREEAPGLAIHDAGSLREFARVYVTPTGLAVACVGLAATFRRSFWRNVTFLVTTVVFACFIFYKIRIIPEHFWLARRFLPVILPATCLLIGAAVALPLSMPSRRTQTGPMRMAILVPSILLLIFLSARFLAATRPILDHVEYAGVIPRLESLEAQFADDDLVLVEARDASDLHTLAVPLAYVYARHVLLMSARNPDRQSFAEFLTWARGRYRRVLFVGSGGSRILSRETMAIPVSADRFFVPEYERSYPAVPAEVRLKQYDFGIYELAPRVAMLDGLDLDVGEADDLHVARFHGKEVGSGELSFRWSTGASFVFIPEVGRHVQTVTLWLSAGGRPASLPPPTVSVFLASRQLGTATVTDGFRPYEFAIGEDHAAEILASDEVIEVRITSTTWTPSEALGGDDTRELGVMVDRLRIE